MSSGEPVPETKQVHDFLAGITGDVLSTSKTFIAGDHEKTHSFEKCQQYLKTVALVRQPNPNSRNVKKLLQEKKGKGKDKGKPKSKAKPKKKSNGDPEINSGQYTNKEYRALSSEQKQAVAALREKDKGDDTKRKCDKLVTAPSQEKDSPDSSSAEEEEHTLADDDDTAEEETEEETEKPIPKKSKASAMKKRIREGDGLGARFKEPLGLSKAKDKLAFSKACKVAELEKMLPGKKTPRETVCGTHAKAMKASQAKLNAGDSFGRHAHAAEKEAKPSKTKKSKKEE